VNGLRFRRRRELRFKEAYIPVVMTTILVIDDDESLRDTIGILLEQEGFCPVLAPDGKEGFERALSIKPDLMIVDLRMPGMNGMEICKQIRAAHLKTPIIVLSAVGEEVDKVLLLEIGADDYVVKPFGARELLARIRAVLRRASGESRKIAHFGSVSIDFERRVVTKLGEALKLTPAEYNLLSYFIHNPDRPLTRDMILNSVWGYESYPNTRTVDAHIVRLRQKLEPDPDSPRHFLTVHGVGYRFMP
jgi:DNA-binding response OmpR family regulator